MDVGFEIHRRTRHMKGEQNTRGAKPLVQLEGEIVGANQARVEGSGLSNPDLNGNEF